MSEYQYYDFKAVDRVLTKAKMAALRDISTRAVITSTSFTNHYEWGNLKVASAEAAGKVFRRLCLSGQFGNARVLSASSVEAGGREAIKAMLPGKTACVRLTGEYAIICFRVNWSRTTGTMALAG